MFLFQAFTSLSLFLLLTHLFSLLLIKLFSSLYLRASAEGDFQLHTEESNPLVVAAEELSPTDEDRDLVADVILGGEGLFFLYNQSHSDDNNTLLVEQGKDSKEQVSFEVGDTLVSESASDSPKNLSVPINDVLTPSDCPSPIVSAFDNTEVVAPEEEKSEEHENKEEKKDFFVDQDRENLGGSLTGESTSKSSIEWRSSTIEYPLSSSSRRSSSHWESYTVFRRYDEEMIFFDRIGAQKLTETESFRSLRENPRSISQRIVHKLTTRNKDFATTGGRNPYKELESAYVAQICLTWEALNCNYSNFKRVISDRRKEDSGIPARVAQQFQQFQVLLQRFIENEPYERGRRPEVYARVRISSPKLLRVPEFRDSEDDDQKEDISSMISSEEFLVILEDAIQTFMDFLKADKESHCHKFRAFIRRKPSLVDPSFLYLLKKVNKKKRSRLRELGRRRKSPRKRGIKGEKEMEVLMGMIDMKVVSRVLRMPDVSEQQLHWCEEKMSKVRVWDGKIQRDSFPLFFPSH